MDTDGLTITRVAPVRRLPLSEHSWVDVVDGFVRNAEAEFNEILAASPWMQGEVLRYDSYIPEQRLGAGLVVDSRALFRQTELHLEASYRRRFSGVAAVLYRDGKDHQGLHSDRQLRWLDDTLVAIVVLGQRRPFVIRRRGPMKDINRTPAGEDPADIVLTPGEGDMVVMGGAAQREFLHGVPSFDTPQPRISLTWRWTSRRGRPIPRRATSMVASTVIVPDNPAHGARVRPIADARSRRRENGTQRPDRRRRRMSVPGPHNVRNEFSATMSRMRGLLRPRDATGPHGRPNPPAGTAEELKENTMAKYLLLKHYRGAPAAVNDVAMDRWTPDEVEAHIQYMNDFATRLERNGEFIDGQALSPDGVWVRYDGEGQPPVTDGPFAETKDLIAGWMVIDVDSYERAVELAGELSAAPGAGGKPIHEWLELRPFLTAPPTVTQ